MSDRIRRELTEGCEFLFEVVIRESTGILKVTQVVIGEDMEVAVGDDRLERAPTAVGDAVLGIREPTEEVLRAVVERFLDEVMTEAVVGFAVSVDEGRSFTIEDLAHEDVAGSISFLTIHGWCSVPSSGRFSSSRGGVIMR